MIAGFLLRCQNSLGWEICSICHWNIVHISISMGEICIYYFSLLLANQFFTNSSLGPVETYPGATFASLNNLALVYYAHSRSMGDICKYNFSLLFATHSFTNSSRGPAEKLQVTYRGATFDISQDVKLLQARFGGWHRVNHEGDAIANFTLNL